MIAGYVVAMEIALFHVSQKVIDISKTKRIWDFVKEILEVFYWLDWLIYDYKQLCNSWHAIVLCLCSRCIQFSPFILNLRGRIGKHFYFSNQKKLVVFEC